MDTGFWRSGLAGLSCALFAATPACHSIVEYGNGAPLEGVDAGPWTNVTANLAGLPSECGSVASLSTRPDRDVVIAGVALHGLWANADGGTAWSRLGESTGSATIINRPTAIVYDPEHPRTWWESGIYNGNAVYRTDDDGATFQVLGDAVHCDLVSIDFADPARQTLLAGGHESRRLLRSTNGGLTWTDIAGTLPADVGSTTFPLVIDAQVHLIGSYNGASAGVHRTEDGGKTWARVSAIAVKSRPQQTADGAIYWMAEDNLGVVRSLDQGRTWTRVIGPGVLASTETGLVVLPSGRLVAAGGRALMISKDRGTTWQSLGQPLPFAPAGVVYSPARKSFYIWHYLCNVPPVVVPDDAILAMSFDDGAP